ncbi:MAG: biotin--[acetyl-CoA-carboxylase] ligase [Anaerolineae bacterium]|nr:biotin--[acetyl-CoA-carboxylase] ligase [Anaerolineae bacterium]
MVYPARAALAVSVILHPSTLQPDLLSLINGLGALAIADGLANWYGLISTIKWPNDVLLNGKKVAGVLPEAHWQGDRLQGVVLGMGINVGSGAVPPAGSVNFPAGCVEEAVGRPVAREMLLREIMLALIHWAGKIGTPGFLQAWDAHLAFKNENVRVIQVDAVTVEGQILGLTPQGNLQLLVGEEIKVFGAGEIQLRPVSTG